MKTIIYMVRHAESPYTEGTERTERTRGLTSKGKMDAEQITEILKDEGLDMIISSPYARAILTLEGIARELEINIQTFEDLRERDFSDVMITDEEFIPATKKMFDDPDYALPGGESNTICQNRSVAVAKHILEAYKGKKVAMGTHGHVMTLMMNYFDSNYGLNFLNQLKKPDVYKLKFEDLKLVEEVTRLWKK